MAGVWDADLGKGITANCPLPHPWQLQGLRQRSSTQSQQRCVPENQGLQKAAGASGRAPLRTRTRCQTRLVDFCAKVRFQLQTESLRDAAVGLVMDAAG